MEGNAKKREIHYKDVTNTEPGEGRQLGCKGRVWEAMINKTSMAEQRRDRGRPGQARQPIRYSGQELRWEERVVCLG